MSEISENYNDLFLEILKCTTFFLTTLAVRLFSLCCLQIRGSWDAADHSLGSDRFAWMRVLIWYIYIYNCSIILMLVLWYMVFVCGIFLRPHCADTSLYGNCGMAYATLCPFPPLFIYLFTYFLLSGDCYCWPFHICFVYGNRLLAELFWWN